MLYYHFFLYYFIIFQLKPEKIQKQKVIIPQYLYKISLNLIWNLFRNGALLMSITIITGNDFILGQEKSKRHQKSTIISLIIISAKINLNNIEIHIN